MSKWNQLMVFATLALYGLLIAIGFANLQIQIWKIGKRLDDIEGKIQK